MRKGLIGLLASTVIVFAACQGASTPSPSAAASPSSAASTAPSPSPSPAEVDYDQLLYGSTYAPEQGTPGGKVIISDWQAANQLNPYFSNAFTNTQVYAATMRTLLVVAADGHYRPDLASEPITFSKNVTQDSSGSGFTVNAKLKAGLKWSDGEPLTMNDWKFAWEYANDKEVNSPQKLGWDKVDKVDVVSDTEANFHFKEAYAGWLGTVGGNYPLPAHYFANVPKKDGNKAYPLTADIAKSPTSGPYKYVTATPDTIELARNDNWAVGDHAPYLDAVTFKFYPDNKDGEIAAFKAGEIDVALDLVQADYDAIKDVDPAIGKAILEPAWLYEHLDFNLDGLNEGLGNPALKDINVRKAIALAIDRTELWKTVFPGSPVPTEPACTNATPTNYWYLPGAGTMCATTADLDAAKKLLDDNGYTMGADGIRTDPKNSGNTLTFQHCTSTAAFRETAGEYFASQLAKIGIKMELNFVDSTNVLFALWPDVADDTKCNLVHGNYDTAEFAWVLSFDLFGDYYYAYHSSQIPTKDKQDGSNSLRLKDTEMDAAIDVLTDAVNPKDQVEAAYTIQEVYIDKQVEVPLYYRNEARGVAADLKNFLKNPSTSSDVWNIEDWFRSGS